LGLIIHPTSINQHLGWQQFVTPLIARQPIVISHPPYLMWYNIVLDFVTMDLNMYFMYCFGIKRVDPLILEERKNM
jgi:hypothetical protein